ncbi:hypothetical protein [Streptomyces chartreusis]|uniref:hypothetical protein n=1 Tax=Streptomyces chartreusis TaxID=1969 RepID=UPI003653A5E7
MTIARYAEQFLLCALAAPGGSLSDFLDPDAIMASAQLDEEAQNAIIAWLVTQQYVTTEVRADGSAYLVKLTANGLEHAREWRRRTQSKVERERYLQEALMRWAYDNSPANGSVSLQRFAADERWWFHGTEVTWDEVYDAVHFLEAEGLLWVELPTGMTRVRPTPLGTKFAHSHMTLRYFMTTSQPQSSNVTNNFNNSNVVQGDAPGSNFATGDNVTQSVNQGVDADALAGLVAQLREIAPTLDLSEDDAADLAEEIDALAAEGDEPSRGRRIMRSLARMMLPAAGTAASEAAVQAAIEAGAGMFG